MDINTAQHSTVITFSNYHEGSAPALIMNHTQWDVLTYKQRYEKSLCEKLDFFAVIGPQSLLENVGVSHPRCLQTVRSMWCLFLICWQVLTQYS